MYLTWLVIHSTFRWVALIFLVYAIFRAINGYHENRTFSKADNAFRHWTATVLQIQMMIGLVLYFNTPGTSHFFNFIHLPMMFIAVTIVSIGSAIAKRKAIDRQKYQTMLLWFGIGLIIMLISIPWPFSPLAQRPYLRIL